MTSRAMNPRQGSVSTNASPVSKRSKAAVPNIQKNKENMPLPKSSKAQTEDHDMSGEEWDDDEVEMDMPAQRQRPSKPVPKARGSGSSKPSSSRAAKSAASSSQPKARIPAGSKRPAPEIASEAEDLDPEDDEERMAMEDDVDDLEATPRATRHDAKVVRSRNQKATRAASTRTEGQNFTRGRAASDASILGSDAEEAHGRGQRAKKNLANTQRMRQLELEDAEALDEDDNLELDDEIGHTQKPTRREKELEDRLAQMSAERDAVQAEFDELRKLRHTEAENVLAEWKRVAETRHRHSQELIASLKARVEAAERRARCYEAGAGASASVAGDRSLSILGSVRGVSTTPGPATRDDFAEREERERLEKAHKRELLVKDKKVQDLEVEIKRLNRELETEIASSRALLERASFGAASTKGSTAATSVNAKAGAALAAADALERENAQAVLRLYEDLTGLVIHGTEIYDKDAGFRRFKAIFAAPNFHDLQLWLEESTSDLPATEDDGPGAKNGRKDLVYYPQLEDDRDAAVLASERLPEHFKDTLRFDRASGVKFLDQLKRGLRM